MSYTEIYLGPYDDNLNFKYEEKTEVKQSCATVLNGEMYVLRPVSF